MDNTITLYKDQINQRRKQCSPDEQNIFDLGVQACEDATIERLRNLLTPMYNAVQVMKDSNALSEKMLKIIFSKSSINIMEDNINKLLNLYK